jgi:CRP/FNR family transcriptional regulator, cyclic AMP receptor protein
LSVSDDPVPRLGAMRLFEGLAPRELREVARSVDARTYRPRTVIFCMGDLEDRLYILDRGIIKLSTVSPDGVERVLDVMVAGSIFGEPFLSQNSRRTVTVESLTAASVWTMAADTFASSLNNIPTLCRNFVNHLMNLQHRALNRLIAQMETDRGVRLLAVLVDLAQRCGHRTDDDYTLPAELTQGELAQLVGINRSTVSLLLNDYRRTGVLGGQGSVLVIHATAAKSLLRKAGVLFP